MQGKPLSGFPCAFNQRPPTAALIFAEQKSAAPKESHPKGGSLLVPRRGFTLKGINFDSPEARRQKRKIPKGIFLFCGCPQVLLSALLPTARKGECEGETFAGFPTRVQSPARRRPILRSKIAAPKKKDTHEGVFLFWSGRRGSNSLPRPWQGRALPDELRPQAAPLLQRLWCLRPGSNRRHADFQSAALPTELPRHIGDQEGARTLDLQRDRLAF